jgi:hypothetical protein
LPFLESFSADEDEETFRSCTSDLKPPIEEPPKPNVLVAQSIIDNPVQKESQDADDEQESAELDREANDSDYD